MSNTQCSVCGSSVSEEIEQIQRNKLDIGTVGGPDCESCIRDVRNNPQLENLIEQIAESLNDVNAAIYRDSDKDEQIMFAVHCLNEEIVEGGSLGFHTQLHKYMAIRDSELAEQ
jgi:hypothetical protein